MSEILFNSANGAVTSEDLIRALLDIHADECDVLYIHTGMRFGMPAVGKKVLLQKLYSVIASLKVKTVIFPTFTFSFCNHKPFDVKNSPSKMGVINEYVRKNIEGVRTSDPLLSVYVCGDTLGLDKSLSSYSIGEDSTYDRLHKSGLKIKFLFFGALMWECFTYTHYMEAIMQCPYRYNRGFEGDIIMPEGNTVHREFFLYTSYGNVKLNGKPLVYSEMKSRGQLNEAITGDSTLVCFNEKDAYNTIKELLSKDPYYLTDGSFKLSEINKIYNPLNKEINSVC